MRVFPKYLNQAASLMWKMNEDYWRLRRSADKAIERGDYAEAVTDAEDAVEISALYMHIGFAIRSRDEREGLREFNRETGDWYRAIEAAYREQREPPASFFSRLFGRG